MCSVAFTREQFHKKFSVGDRKLHLKTHQSSVPADSRHKWPVTQFHVNQLIKFSDVRDEIFRLWGPISYESVGAPAPKVAIALVGMVLAA